MGGALALHAAFMYPKPLAGVVVASGFMLQREQLLQHVQVGA